MERVGELGKLVQWPCWTTIEGENGGGNTRGGRSMLVLMLGLVVVVIKRQQKKDSGADFWYDTCSTPLVV